MEDSHQQNVTDKDALHVITYVLTTTLHLMSHKNTSLQQFVHKLAHANQQASYMESHAESAKDAFMWELPPDHSKQDSSNTELI